MIGKTYSLIHLPEYVVNADVFQVLASDLFGFLANVLSINVFDHPLAYGAFLS